LTAAIAGMVATASFAQGPAPARDEAANGAD
jgi:hypothetical protein